MSGIGNHTTGIQTLRRYIDAAERRLLDPLGLTVAQFEALDTLSCNPGVSAGAMAGLLNISCQAAHVQITILIERGLIERGQPGDVGGRGRPQPLKLTRAGRSALRSARTRTARVDAAFTGALGAEHLAELQRLLAIGIAAFADTAAAQAQA